MSLPDAELVAARSITACLPDGTTICVCFPPAKSEMCPSEEPYKPGLEVPVDSFADLHKLRARVAAVKNPDAYSRRDRQLDLERLNGPELKRLFKVRLGIPEEKAISHLPPDAIERILDAELWTAS